MSDIIDRKAEIRAKNAFRSGFSLSLFIFIINIKFVVTFSSADKVLRDAKVKYLKDEESLKPIR